jgi:hypothetical protein
MVKKLLLNQIVINVMAKELDSKRAKAKALDG